MVSRSCFQPCNPESMEQGRAARTEPSCITKRLNRGKMAGREQRADTGRGQQRDATGLSSTTQDGNDFSFKNL